MKIPFLILAFAAIFHSQLFAQIIDHPVIEKVQAFYKPTANTNSQQGTQGIPSIKVVATIKVNLKDSIDAVKLYLKITNQQTGQVIYNVNYLLNSAPVIDNGVTLYKKENNVVELVNPAEISLRPFRYELYTEDAQGNPGIVYTTMQ